ncbi:helix-turn-helix domain-containing protein [Sphingomonas faeni]|uniref:helix-turn-helix domain-containing protein n=1 Tax=Sphingomonas faeni TaxID=185950 RepID=UPI00335D6436
MITAIREVRRAKGLTLQDVARRCDPKTTAQTIGRLETGTRTVSIGWLNRIAAALGVEASDLVSLPDRTDLPVTAILDGSGVHAPRRTTIVPAPRVAAGQIAVTVAGGVGDYRAGDVIWCAMLPPGGFATALNRDVLVPQPGGRFAFGRLTASDGVVTLVPLNAGSQSTEIDDPAWLAVTVRLIRDL